MSSFNCEHCGTAIIDTPRGYITSCEHYPLEVVDVKEQASKRFVLKNIKELIDK